MPDWTNATGMQLKIVQEALLSAFPRPEDLEMLLMLQLNQSYVQLTAGSANYRYAVFQVLIDAKAKNWLSDLLKAARRENGGNPKLKALDPLADLTVGSGARRRQARRHRAGRRRVSGRHPLGGTPRQVAHPDLPDRMSGESGGRHGLARGERSAPTNWHVVRRVLAGEKQPGDVVCRFDYATSSSGTNAGVTCGLAAKWCEDYSEASKVEQGTGQEGPTEQQLDYALLRLAKPMGTTNGANAAGGPRGFIATKRGTASPTDNDVVFVLQHPLGEPLKMAIGVAKGTNANTTRVLHDANTESGSSGSPCFNAKLELVALHHAGDLLYDGVIGTPTQNQAVPLEPILARLETQGAPKFWTA